MINLRPLRKFASSFKGYTKPLQINQYDITPIREVPENIVRPPYVNARPQVFPDINSDPIYVHNKEEIESLKVASNLAARSLSHALANTSVGMSLDDVDKLVHEFIIADGGYPSAIGFHQFEKSLCTSVNDVVAHGVPNSYVLQDGDYLNIDIVCYKEGHHGDNSAMLMLGDTHEDIRKLSEETRKSMFMAIKECKPGVNFRKIGEVIEEYANSMGYSVNREFGGHGIGSSLHLAPLVHHYKTHSQRDVEMLPGMAFTIEPILMMAERYNYVQW